MHIGLHASYKQLPRINLLPILKQYLSKRLIGVLGVLISIPKQHFSQNIHEMEDETGTVGIDGRLDPNLSKKLVVASKKQPPPESTDSIRIRSYVIVSFWAVVIFLGLPTWWRTTSIHRARLPLQNMLEWADGKVRSSY